METARKNVQPALNNLYNHSQIMDTITLDDHYTMNETVQDYLHQLAFERHIYDNQLSQMCALELEYNQEFEHSKTRNSQRQVELVYSAQIDRLKLEILETRFKYNRLVAELYKYVVSLKSKAEVSSAQDLLQMYQLENQLEQATRFFYGTETHIDNPALATAFRNYQNRLLELLQVGSPSGTISQNQIGLEKKIVKNNHTIEVLNTQLKTLQDDLEHARNVNSQLNTDFFLLDKLAKSDKEQLKKLLVEMDHMIGKINTLEDAIKDLENVRNSLVEINGGLERKLLSLIKHTSHLEHTIQTVETKNKKLVEQVLALCPELDYNTVDGFQKREDTYDIVDLADGEA